MASERSGKRSPAARRLRSLAARGLPLTLSLALLLLLVGLAVWFGRSGSAQPPSSIPSAPPPPTLPQVLEPRAHPAAPHDTAAYRRQLLQQVQLADQTYCSYRHASEYPHESRPIAEQPDQIWPNTPVLESNPMREEGGATNARVQIQSGQSRVYLAAGESVTLHLRARGSDGQVLPLVVIGALAQGVQRPGQRGGPGVALAFGDDGAGADSVAGDGTHSAVLAPQQTALALFHGTIRTRVAYSVAGRQGVLLFDVIYSPYTPAVWTGQVREALQDGSLDFYLKLDVREAGRYVVSGRIDDARGTPLALLTFNELLAAGPGEVRLRLFGKLARDHQPAMPLVLRDVDGYLLRENADPDRVMLARLSGPVHTSRSHPLKQFSDAEWDSPERRRYLDELARDMNRARAVLGAFDPAAVLAPPCQPAAAQARD